MSVVRPARCLLPRRLPATGQLGTPPRCHALFHSSAQLAARRKPRFKSIRAEEMGLVSPQKVDEFSKEYFPGYSPEELDALKRKYTPEQMAALQAGEAAVDPNDLTIQGRLRRDPYAMPYLDDFSRILPIVDKRPRPIEHPGTQPKYLGPKEYWEGRQKTPKQLAKMRAAERADLMDYGKTFGLKPEQMEGLTNEELEKLVEEKSTAMPEFGLKPGQLDDLTNEELEKLAEEKSTAMLEEVGEDFKKDPEKHPDIERALKQWDIRMKGRVAQLKKRELEAEEGRPTNAVAPGLGKNLAGVAGMYKAPIDPEDEGLDDQGVYQDLKRRTGLTVRQIRDMQTKMLVQKLVVNQTRLGKIETQWCLTVAGNGNGRIGVGIAKSSEASAAAMKARLKAIENMRPIRRYENRTIYGSVRSKFGATIVQIDSRPPGFGIRAQARLFEIFRLAGIQDVAAKVPRGRNPMNTVFAAVEALQSQKDPEELALVMGKKLVDSDKAGAGHFGTVRRGHPAVCAGSSK
ncbi:37S ribosomal protein s5 [Xylariaceae sp. FL0804]|nr:37S ribosomal protein s5 [Xylariaceae sp. FL0804]